MTNNISIQIKISKSIFFIIVGLFYFKTLNKKKFFFYFLIIVGFASDNHLIIKFSLISIVLRM